MSDQVTIQLLGPVRVRTPSGEVPLRGGRQLTLFAVLVAEAGRTVSVERLVDALWETSAPAGARRSLQSYVSRLRRQLEPATGMAIASAPTGYHLVTDDRHAIDVIDFEVAIAHLPADPAAVVDHLDTALALWRGVPFADLDETEWARTERERLLGLRSTAERTRAGALADVGRLTEATRALEGLLADHPYDEDLVARLARVRYATTGSAAALRTIADARTRLRDDLGVDPGPALMRLEHRILEHRLDELPTSTAPATQAAPAESALPGPLAREGRFGFVGRASERASIDHHWRAATTGGAARLVEIVGEAGAGKTSLAAQPARRCHDDGADVVYVRWDERVDVGDQPLTEVLGVPLPGETAADPGRRRLLLYERAADLVRARAAAAPLLLVADDIQWADESSLGLLAHLLTSTEIGPVLVVATRRTPSTARVEIDWFLATLQRADRLHRITLPPLDADDLRAMADLDDSALASISRRSGGNAFYAVQLLTQHLEDGDVASAPAGVRDVLRERLGRLSPTARAIVETAAVIGDQLELDLVADAADRTPDEVLDAVAEAESLGLVTGDPGGGLRFSHDLTRTALIDDLDSTTALRIHLRVAGALEHRAVGPERAAELAHHYWQARTIVPGKALRSSVEAARRASERIAYDQAEQWYRRALDLEPDPRTRLEHLLALGRVQKATGESVRYRPSFEQAFDLADELDDPVAMAHAALGHAPSAQAVLDGDSLALLERALAALPDEEAELALRLRISLHTGADMRPAADRHSFVSSVDELVDDSRRLGEPELVFDALAVALANPDPVLSAESRARAEELCAIAESQDDPRLRVRASLSAARVRTETADVHGAETALTEAEALVRWLPHEERRSARYRISQVRTAIAIGCGRFADARRHMEEGRRHETDTYVQYPYQRALLDWLEGDGERLLAPGPLPEPPDGVVVQLMAANALHAALREEHALAVERLERLTDHADDIARYPIAAPTACALAIRAVAVVGPGPWVAALERLLEPYAGIFVCVGGTTALIGAIEGYAGVLAHQAADGARAEEQLRIAIDRNARHGLLPFTAFAWYDLGRLLTDLDRCDEARAATGEAEGIVTSLGMSGLGAQVAELRARLGA